MSYNSIRKCLIDNKLWSAISVLLLGWYLSPLFYHTFYVPIFDNLDSNVVWFKILAESGKIFAPNNAIIQNMMGGLPRSSYGSEFNLILWLYYFFKPQTAYIINEVLIHLIAFFSMFLFLRKYVVAPSNYYGNVPTFLGAITFALLPFWSGAGASIALLPLVTYSLLNIKSGKDNKWDWIILILLPLYSSLVFLYVFYLLIAGIYFLYDSIKHRKINKKFLIALILIGTIFLITEYRLVYTMFFDKNFISHRVEFQIFFQENLWESYRLALVNFLQGHHPHAMPLQQPYILPIILSALLLQLLNRKLTSIESLIIWGILLVTFFLDIWSTVLINKFTIPGIFLLTIFVYFRTKKLHVFPLLIILVLALSFIAAAFEYHGLSILAKEFPFFNTFNMVRIIFIEPFIYALLLTYSSIIFFRKLQYTEFFIFIFLAAQFHYSLQTSFYQKHPIKGYASFQEYYVPKLFNKLTHHIPALLSSQTKVVNYGMEPAVALFNGLYTVDGYSVNYPIAYKYKFKKVFEQYKYPKLFDTWGSKVYIMTVPTKLDTYLSIKGVKIEDLRFDTIALCQLHTRYMLSPYLFQHPGTKKLELIDNIKGDKRSWDLYLYRINCD